MATAHNTFALVGSLAPAQNYFDACRAVAHLALNGEIVGTCIGAIARYFEVPVGTVEQDIAEFIDLLND